MKILGSAENQTRWAAEWEAQTLPLCYAALPRACSLGPSFLSYCCGGLQLEKLFRIGSIWLKAPENSSQLAMTNFSSVNGVNLLFLVIGSDTKKILEGRFRSVVLGTWSCGVFKSKKLFLALSK